MEPFLPGDVVEVVQDRGHETVTVHYICIDSHLCLYLLALTEEPFHQSYVHIALGQQDWVAPELFIQTNILHEVYISGRRLGRLNDYVKQLIADGAKHELALVDDAKLMIVERLLNEPDVSYYDMDEDDATD